MTLKSKLDRIRVAGEKRLPAEALTVMKAETEAQREAGITKNILKVGETLPPFSLENHRGETVESSALLSRGPIMLTVYRGLW